MYHHRLSSNIIRRKPISMTPRMILKQESRLHRRITLNRWYKSKMIFLLSERLIIWFTLRSLSAILPSFSLYLSSSLSLSLSLSLSSFFFSHTHTLSISSSFRYFTLHEAYFEPPPMAQMHPFPTYTFILTIHSHYMIWRLTFTLHPTWQYNVRPICYLHVSVFCLLDKLP